MGFKMAATKVVGDPYTQKMMEERKKACLLPHARSLPCSRRAQGPQRPQFPLPQGDDVGSTPHARPWWSGCNCRRASTTSKNELTKLICLNRYCIVRSARRDRICFNRYCTEVERKPAQDQGITRRCWARRNFLLVHGKRTLASCFLARSHPACRHPLQHGLALIEHLLLSILIQTCKMRYHHPNTRLLQLRSRPSGRTKRRRTSRSCLTRRSRVWSCREEGSGGGRAERQKERVTVRETWCVFPSWGILIFICYPKYQISWNCADKIKTRWTFYSFFTASEKRAPVWPEGFVG